MIFQPRVDFMLLAGIAVEIGWFTGSPAQPNTQTGEFSRPVSVFCELEKLSLSAWSFSAEIGLREAFGNHLVLCGAVSGFRKLLLTPRLYTTGVHFDHRTRALAELEELSRAGVQQILLRVDQEEARALGSDCVINLVDGCHANGIDLRLQFEMHDTFSEDCYRIARCVEDRQFTVTVLPVRIRPARSLTLEQAPPIPRGERVQIVLNATGEVMLRRRTQDAVVDITTGNVYDRPLHELIAVARARL